MYVPPWHFFEYYRLFSRWCGQAQEMHSLWLAFVLVLQSQPGSPIVRPWAQLREHIRACRSFRANDTEAFFARGRTHHRLPGIVDLRTVQYAILDLDGVQTVFTSTQRSRQVRRFVSPGKADTMTPEFGMKYAARGQGKWTVWLNKFGSRLLRGDDWRKMG